MTLHYNRYKELCNKYKISDTAHVWDTMLKTFRPFTDEELTQFDVIVTHVKSHYGRDEYKIIKNKPKLSSKDLAIICDKGNLAFGYTGDQKRLSVYTE